MTNKEKFLELVSKEQSNTLERNRSRIKNRATIRESQKIALKVLIRLKELKWKQKDLASALDVTPQQVTKIVNGKGNLTIETQIKLQTILDIPILASYYEDKMKQSEIFEIYESGIKVTYEPSVSESEISINNEIPQNILSISYNSFFNQDIAS